MKLSMHLERLPTPGTPRAPTVLEFTIGPIPFALGSGRLHFSHARRGVVAVVVFIHAAMLWGTLANHGTVASSSVKRRPKLTGFGR
jgi:hypothetical protein